MKGGMLVGSKRLKYIHILTDCFRSRAGNRSSVDKSLYILLVAIRGMPSFWIRRTPFIYGLATK